MAFKLPKLPGPSKSKHYAFDKNITVVKWEELDALHVIGRGQFGEVSKVTYQKQDIVMKRLLSEQEEDRRCYMKEVNIMSHLSHPNLIDIKAVCPEKCAILMEYMAFDFEVLGTKDVVSSLSEFLNLLDRTDTVDYFDFFPLVGQKVTEGLKYLHENGIAHRDLKPGNILVSNQHYCHSHDKQEIESIYRTDPILIKLCDFGESRSKMFHTNTILQTRTLGLGRGTPAFMAPEIRLDSDMLPIGATMEDLMKADVWSLGMTLFAIINPSLKHPYEQNLKEATGKRKLSSILLENPKPDVKYKEKQETSWSSLLSAYKKCVLTQPIRRPDLESVIQQLQVIPR
ncbi:serine/threonine-protein kinase 4 homolog B-like [Lytechinus pictus]|uniref:serine/threonine-protein kinase 4 homolog B-like n=1 Tax=Lytechinus pictus TaxID=7653 RepID=UPI0030B9DF6C